MVHSAVSFKTMEYFFPSKNCCLKRLHFAFVWLITEGLETRLMFIAPRQVFESNFCWAEARIKLFYASPMIILHYDTVCNLACTCMGSAILYFLERSTWCYLLWGDLEANMSVMVSFTLARALGLTYPKACHLPSREEILCHSRAI